MLWFLALRDIQVRYKQIALRELWAVIQPLSMMVVFELILTQYLDQSSDFGGRYAKLLPCTFFSSAVVASTNSLVTNGDMLRKIYFPRLLVPIAAVELF